ncbi:unnamed protein product [Phyllotreta striolata]|uniref:Vitellogenin domain-containing protein n=1 Tax=Phyllotreta striolata TaxID=444603 RepID=A0A9N9U2H8_PHYSR|nr:unnamed protein product [Phyllotreta striolata]
MNVLCVLFGWSIGVCYGFVLLSSASEQAVEIFESGRAYSYEYRSIVSLNEENRSGKVQAENPGGFSVEGDVTVQVVAEIEGGGRCLKIEFLSPKLRVPSKDRLVFQPSRLDATKNSPFFALWESGKVSGIFLEESEEVSMKNLKKGIASLLQFQLVNGKLETEETDSSGKCSTVYISTTDFPSNLTKTKSNCISPDLDKQEIPQNPSLSVEILSKRTTNYQFQQNPDRISSIHSREIHSAFLSAREEMGNRLETEETLILRRFGNVDIENSQKKAGKADEFVENFGREKGLTYARESLLTEIERNADGDVGKSFGKTVEFHRDSLKVAEVATTKQSRAFLEVLKAARKAEKRELLDVLKAKKNKEILPQLYDVLGHVGTQEAHQAVTKRLHFEKHDLTDLSERYLWALAFSPRPRPEVIKDLLDKFSKLNDIPEKVQETLVLAVASMARKLHHVHQGTFEAVQETILNNLDYAKGDGKLKYLRALRNLKAPNTLPVLFKYISSGTALEGALSWRAVEAMVKDNRRLNTTDVLSEAEKTLFQLNRRHDSSARTIAADILIEESRRSGKLSGKLLDFLVLPDPNYEVKRYVRQRIEMAAERDGEFGKSAEKRWKGERLLNNYSGASPRGLSVSLARKFLEHPSWNGSLVAVQEMKSGVVKRGKIDVVMEKNGLEDELFSLGIFSNGLHSFMSGDEEEAEEEGTSAATAGIELAVLGAQIRPFVFFEGQGELMGHVWSGTASELTPAFQVITLLQDQSEYVRLGSGLIGKIDIKGAASLDLSGQIEISLWNRNARSLVRKSAGIVVIGSTGIDSSFVKSSIEFVSSIEPILNLQTDIDFSSNLQLCMRLTQPETVLRHTVRKIEAIPENKKETRTSKNRKMSVPGKSYNFNKKNNEMCKALFG